MSLYTLNLALLIVQKETFMTHRAPMSMKMYFHTKTRIIKVRDAWGFALLGTEVSATKCQGRALYKYKRYKKGD